MAPLTCIAKTQQGTAQATPGKPQAAGPTSNWPGAFSLRLNEEGGDTVKPLLSTEFSMHRVSSAPPSGARATDFCST